MVTRITPDDVTGLDEVVVGDATAVHLEWLDDDMAYLAIQRADGGEVRVNLLVVDGKLHGKVVDG